MAGYRLYFLGWDMVTRYTADELLGMTAARLQQYAFAVGMKKPFNKNQNRQRRAEMILKHFAKEDVTIKAGATGKPADGLAPENPAFEQKCSTVEVQLDGDGPHATTDATPQAPDGRGGARPGAGRPSGMTAERARLTHVTDTPHRIYVALFRTLFKLWADTVGCDKVELTEQEAIDLALPWSQIGEYLGWNDYIPEWADIVICGIWTTWNTVALKARIAREFKAQHAGESVTSAKPDEATVQP